LALADWFNLGGMALPLIIPMGDNIAQQALRSSLDTVYFTAFCTPDGHLLVNRYYRHSSSGFGIHVYALDMQEEIPKLLATFELPRLNWDFSSWLNSTFFPGYGKYSQLAGGIAAGPTDFQPSTVLIQLRIDLQYTLFTPLSTFLSRAVLENRHRPSPLRYSWNSWGPRSTRILHEDMDSAMICGYKAIYPSHYLDFCPVVAAGRGLEEESVTRSETVIHAPVFSEPVVTRLPFRKVELPLTQALARDQMQLYFEDKGGPKVGIIHDSCQVVYTYRSSRLC
jgi:hypothetical protein